MPYKMKVKGYAAVISYNDRDGYFHGKILDIPEEVYFKAYNLKELKTEFADKVQELKQARTLKRRKNASI